MLPSQIYFARGGKSDLYKLPPRKDPPTNDWLDEQGLEVDLSTPLWSSYTMELSFVVGVHADRRHLGSPELLLDDEVKGILLQDKPSLYLPYRHRLQSVTSFELHKRIAAAEIACAYEILAPEEVWQRFSNTESTVEPLMHQQVTINGRDLGTMGIGVVSYYDSALMPEELKEGKWLSDSLFRSGRELGSEKTLFTTPREVEVKCVIPYHQEERQLVASLSQLAKQLTKEGPQTLNGRNGYYTRMEECKLTRSGLYFTLYFQMI